MEWTGLIVSLVPRLTKWSDEKDGKSIERCGSIPWCRNLKGTQPEVIMAI